MKIQIIDQTMYETQFQLFFSESLQLCKYQKGIISAGPWVQEIHNVLDTDEKTQNRKKNLEFTLLGKMKKM